jgi:hypothetical protein
MADMTISEFYDELLSDKEFQNPETGKLFFPTYIFTYNHEKEYEIRKEIDGLKDRLERPNNFIDTLILNIFDEFIDFLKEDKLGNDTMLNLLLDKENNESQPQELFDILQTKAHSIEFFDYIHHKAEAHFNLPSKFQKVYLMLYGFGSIFPFLRTSAYLKNFEEHVKGYKLIVFFPGTYKEQNYRLFNDFRDENIYRATLINR